MLVVLIVLISALPSFAKELPESITIGGEVFIIDKTAVEGNNTATPDNIMKIMRSGYEVTASDVALYTAPRYVSSYGYVEATAPQFTARAEVWVNGKVWATGRNQRNRRNIATATSYEGRFNEDATPRIFYSFQ